MPDGLNLIQNGVQFLSLPEDTGKQNHEQLNCRRALKSVLQYVDCTHVAGKPTELQREFFLPRFYFTL